MSRWLRRWNWGDLTDHGELGPALHKMPAAHVRNGLLAAIRPMRAPNAISRLLKPRGASSNRDPDQSAPADRDRITDSSAPPLRSEREFAVIDAVANGKIRLKFLVTVSFLRRMHRRSDRVWVIAVGSTLVSIVWFGCISCSAARPGEPFTSRDAAPVIQFKEK
jgi:hypothetical protein